MINKFPFYEVFFKSGISVEFSKILGAFYSQWYLIITVDNIFSFLAS